MKNLIRSTVQDLITSFLYYDRKEDEDLKPGDIENAIETGTISVNDICEEFKSGILSHLPDKQKGVNNQYYTRAEIDAAIDKHSEIYVATGCDSKAVLAEDENHNVIEFSVELVGNLGYELKGCSMCYGPRDDN